MILLRAAATLCVSLAHAAVIGKGPVSLHGHSGPIVVSSLAPDASLTALNLAIPSLGANWQPDAPLAPQVLAAGIKVPAAAPLIAALKDSRLLITPATPGTPSQTVLLDLSRELSASNARPTKGTAAHLQVFLDDTGGQSAYNSLARAFALLDRNADTERVLSEIYSEPSAASKPAGGSMRRFLEKLLPLRRGGAAVAPPTLSARDEIFNRFGIHADVIDVLGPDRDGALDRAAAALAEMPAFLRFSGLRALTWHVINPGQQPSGWADLDRKKAHIAASLDEPTVEHILVHELAHLYADAPEHADIVEPYLTLRYRTPGMRARLARLRRYVRARVEIDPYHDNLHPDAFASTVKDAKIRRVLLKQRLPRHDAHDTHGVWSASEYWAYSIELFHQHQRAGNLEGLDAYLSEPEIAFLKSLFLR